MRSTLRAVVPRTAKSVKRGSTDDDASPFKILLHSWMIHCSCLVKILELRCVLIVSPPVSTKTAISADESQ